MSRAVIAPEGAIRIVRAVEDEAGMARGVLMEKWRTRSRVVLRRRAALLCRAAGFSLPEIGAAMNRDHTTVLWILRGGKKKGRPMTNRERAKKSREARRAKGRCERCPDAPARPGRTTCEACAHAQKLRAAIRETYA
jgi:hypothetical protein